MSTTASIAVALVVLTGPSKLNIGKAHRSGLECRGNPHPRHVLLGRAVEYDRSSFSFPMPHGDV